MSPKAYATYSDGIRKRNDLWLKYEYKDIKYLIVGTERDREELIRFIKDDLSNRIDVYEQMLLISKIIIWNEMKRIGDSMFADFKKPLREMKVIR